jgi:hypothetical protein
MTTRGRRRERTRKGAAGTATSGLVSGDGCHGIRASTEPDERGQSQRGTLPLVEEVNESRDRHEKARESMRPVSNFLIHTALLYIHSTTMHFHALVCPHMPSSRVKNYSISSITGLQVPHLHVGEDWATESCKTPAERGRWPGAPGGETNGRELVSASSP